MHNQALGIVVKFYQIPMICVEEVGFLISGILISGFLLRGHNCTCECPGGGRPGPCGAARPPVSTPPILALEP